MWLRAATTPISIAMLMALTPNAHAEQTVTAPADTEQTLTASAGTEQTLTAPAGTEQNMATQVDTAARAKFTNQDKASSRLSPAGHRLRVKSDLELLVPPAKSVAQGPGSKTAGKIVLASARLDTKGVGSVKRRRARSARASARLVAAVNLSTQRMSVKIDGVVTNVWKISSGKKGYITPRGTYTPYRMHTMWRSRKYNNAKMPHSVFYSGGFAVHATYATRRLGRPASHGCVRLSPNNARKFFNLVKKYGRKGTRISITGSTPVTRTYARRSKRTTTRRRIRRQARYRAYGAGYNRTAAIRRNAKVRRRYYAPRRQPKGLFATIFE